MNQAQPKKTKAFTLIELLVVISIIALLLAILMPALSRARDQAKQVVCLTQLGQIGYALQMYAQDNSDYVVPGRWHNGGDWNSVNTWYSNLTPYLDTTKSKKDKVYIMMAVEAVAYNHIWEELVCPAEKNPVIALYQGVSVRTYGINIAVNYVPGTTFPDGYGLQDWNSGVVRKTTRINRPSSVAAFCDTRNVEYTGAGHHLLLESQGYTVADYLPARHPGGYNVAFVDGHSEKVTEESFKGEFPYLLWRAE